MLKGIKTLYKSSKKPFEHGPHITRFYMYEEIKDSIAIKSEGKVLSISHSIPLCNYLNMDALQIVEANYPEHDILNLDAFPKDDFDYVICAGRASSSGRRGRLPAAAVRHRQLPPAGRLPEVGYFADTRSVPRIARSGAGAARVEYCSLRAVFRSGNAGI
jgi:hypothetical protein